MANNSMYANNKIISPSNVTYQAGKAILLTPGFEVMGVFKAEIRGFDN
ncbi:3-coathanger stack domain-containing protein [Emticicia sp.]